MKVTRKAAVMVVFALVLLMSGPAFSGPLPRPASENPEAQKLIDKAWDLEKTGSSAEMYKQCQGLMEQAHKADPNNHTILIDIARYWWNHGDKLPKETDEQHEMLEAIYARGMAAAEKALEIKETADGHYWYAVNKAASLEFSSIFSQAAGFPTILKHSGYVSDHDPDYYYGASGRLWTEILTRVPKVVVRMVGYDVQEVLDDIDSSIEKEPRYFDNYVYKARFTNIYFEKKDEALELLDHVLKQDVDIMPEEVKANRVSQDDARELWKEITGKDYPR